MASPEAQLLMLLRQQAEADYIGEPVNQLEHALQAASFAEAEGASEAVILAALLHDIGHICDPRAKTMADVGVLHHEQIGADFLLAMGLDPAIAELVANHVNAKRYLVYKHPEYDRKLSPASRKTLLFQGGPMTDAEANEFERHPQFAEILKLRAWDEAAKRVDASPRPLAHFEAMISRNRQMPLREQQLSGWHEQGYLKITDWFSDAEVQALGACVTEMQSWPNVPGKWMKYYEEANEQQLCRLENFIQYDRTMANLSVGPAALNLLSILFGEPATLYKEKINFKLPGGKGFLPHQDAPAFTTFGQHYHITMMLSIDATTPLNGCLEVVPGGHRLGQLATAPDLTIEPGVAAGLDWVPITTRPGDLVLFDSFLPHRSADNCSDTSRRAVYATYNRASEGDYRDAYFRAKRAAFPPVYEREPGKHYDAGIFNVGNPISRN